MKQCPACKQNYEDPILIFCLQDGTRLTDSNEATTLKFRAEQPHDLESKDRTLKSNHNGEWKWLYVGLSLCLLSGISISILSEPNTKKILRANEVRGNDTVIFILAVIFIIGACMSFANLKKALSNGQPRKAV
jgi:hypothetical protein